jgi:isoquinoline 1-oxidoreductase subunit beta
MYGAYPIAMMQHAPRDIDIIIRESGNKPGGVGEPPLGPIAAAVANAAYQLTGRRMRELPLGV